MACICSELYLSKTLQICSQIAHHVKVICVLVYLHCVFLRLDGRGQVASFESTEICTSNYRFAFETDVCLAFGKAEIGDS